MNTNRILVVIAGLLAGILLVTMAGVVVLWKYSRPAVGNQHPVTTGDITFGHMLDAIASDPPFGFIWEDINSTV